MGWGYSLESIEQFKSHFYSGGELIHLNNSGQALIPDVNRELAVFWLDKLYKEGAFSAIDGWAQTDITRKKLAQFIGADTNEVSFFQTTASAISQVAFQIPLKEDDEILIWDQEYPSNYYPWQVAANKSKAKLIQVTSDNWQTPAKKLFEHVTDKTRIIAVSWVQYQTGAVTDLKWLAQNLKGRNIWLVADVIQGLGVRPFNFHDSDFDVICGGSHKWLCSGYGAGFMVVKKEKLLCLEPHEVGAMTYGNPDTEKNPANLPKTDATRFEPGSKAMLEVIALGASLDLFQMFGIENIFNEASRLAGLLATGLQKMNFRVICNGPIVNFAPENTEELGTIIQKLEDGKVSFAKRGPGIRLSVHAYNHDSEMARVLKLLA